MIVSKVKKLLNEFRLEFAALKMQNEVLKQQNEALKVQNENIHAQNAELEWAHIFHDTIKDRDWLNNLAISPGRWAANYSFFYLLVKVLGECRPAKIIEFGLGESSKVISAFLKEELPQSSHLIIEQDNSWIEKFSKIFDLHDKSTILHLPMEERIVHNKLVNFYSGLLEKVMGVFDLYVVDGPYGSENYSRYDVVLLAENIQSGDDFIILIDDYHREGERETGSELLRMLADKKIMTFTGSYSGNKSQMVITTEKYRFVTSL